VKVLELLSSPAWTGPAEPMASVARQLQARGHSVEVAVDALRQGDLRAKLTGMGFTVRDDLALSTKAGPIAVVRDLARLAQIGRGFDVVHANFSHDQTLAVLALRRRGEQRVVRTIHSSRAFGRLRGPVHRRSDGLIAVCERHAERLRERFRIAPERVVAIRGAVDTSFFTPHGPDLRQELGIDLSAPVVGIVSRVKPGRGHADLLAAFALVLEELPDARLVVVGRGEGLPELEEGIELLGLREKVVLAGYRTGAELAAAYRTFDVKVLMAEGNDGTCRALLEAMACGRPAISFAAGAPGETIVDGNTGRLIDLAGDGRMIRTELALALVELLSDRARAQAMGQAARERVAAFYTEEQRGAAVERFLDDVRRMPPVR
jgi:glycosyltransferase involved in cell wall biosynthesis